MTTTGVFRRFEAAIEPNKVFVLMPFADRFNGVYTTIRESCRDLGLTCVRADDDTAPGQITEKIFRGIRSADILIADLTGKNANVFYELGLAHAISDRVILITQSSADVPFDLRDWLYIEYENTIGGAPKLVASLTKALNTLVSSPVDRTRGTSRPSVAIPNTQSVASGSRETTALPTDLDMLHLEADIESRNGNLSRARELLARARDLAVDGNGDAATVGNCAIEAESDGFLELAEQLYTIALDRDPEHVNNRQCYISFLLDHRADNPTALATARDLLGTLEREPERQERTRALRIQLATLDEQTDESELNTMLSDLVNSTNPTTIREARPLLALAVKLGRYDILEEIAEKLASSATEQEKATLQRAVADAYAGSDDTELQLKAIAIYEELDETGQGSAEMLHNLATLYYALEVAGWRDKSFRTWCRAYHELPGDTRVKKSFAQFLVRIDRAHVAGYVLKGQPIPNDAMA